MGAVSGASTAILLKRGQPDLKILVVEKTEKFDWKVVDAEISAIFESLKECSFAGAAETGNDDEG